MLSRYLVSEKGDSSISYDSSSPNYSGDGFRGPENVAPSLTDDFHIPEFDASSSGYRYDDRSLNDIGRAEKVELAVARGGFVELPLEPLVTKPTPSTESWKLAGLVLIFLIWVSTASTLLFLYMDRYLFG